MVAVAYDRWSFTVGFNYNKALSGKIFGVLDKWPLMWGGRIREVVAHGGSTVVFSAKTKKKFGSNVFKNPARYQLRLSGVLSIILDQIGIWQSMNFFLREGKTGVPGEEPVGARAVTGTRDSEEPTKNSPQMRRRRTAFTNVPLPSLNLIYSFVRFKFELLVIWIRIWLVNHASNFTAWFVFY